MPAFRPRPSDDGWMPASFSQRRTERSGAARRVGRRAVFRLTVSRSSSCQLANVPSWSGTMGRYSIAHGRSRLRSSDHSRGHRRRVLSDGSPGINDFKRLLQPLRIDAQERARTCRGSGLNPLRRQPQRWAPVGAQEIAELPDSSA